MSKPIFRLHRVSGNPVTDSELLADLVSVAKQLCSSTVQQKQYRSLGRYDDTTVSRRFGSWNRALLAAGISLSNEIGIPDERLFENLLILWQHCGRQPRRRELSAPPSTISQSPYSRRFGSWSAALQAFVNYANGNEAEGSEARAAVEPAPPRTTGRDPSLRLRWRVLQRDRFTCRACGTSPALTPGVELQVDHIVPWDKGGETVMDNLQTLCSACNLGKSNIR